MAPDPQPRRRGRRPTDPQVILDALEALLRERPLHEISVEDILAQAGVARATFYALFPTKYAVARALLDQALEEVDRATATFVERPASADVQESLRLGFEDGVRVWMEHREILESIVANAPVVEEFEAPVREIRERFATAVAAELERQRAAGLAPPGHDATELSSALIESTLQILYRAGREDSRLPAGDGLVDLLMTIWSGSLYFRPPPAR